MKGISVCLGVLLLGPALAQRLPIRTYTTADGLARDNIRCIVQDSHGFLWFCTAEGLSRFDGYRFANYRTEQGLPSNNVTAMLETRQGVYWIATRGEVTRFDPLGAGPSRFHRYALTPEKKRVITSLFEDREGGVWCGTRTGAFPPEDAGVFHLGPRDKEFTRVPLPFDDQDITSIAVDRHGTLWAGSMRHLYSRAPDGTTRNCDAVDGLANEYVMAMLEDRDGRLWIGTRRGLVRLDSPVGAPKSHVYTTADGLPSARIQALLETSDGTVWVGTSEGIAEWTGSGFRAYTTTEGLTGKSVGALAEDRDGNLWIGTEGSGAMKVARGGFTTYPSPDWGPSPASLLQSANGEMLLVHERAHAEPRLEWFDGRRFLPVKPAWPRGTESGWGSGQVALQDHQGEWWIATGRGLLRFARTSRVAQLEGARPTAIYTQKDGLWGSGVFQLFEDSRGNIWIGTIGPDQEDGLALWDRRTGTIHAFTQQEGVPRQAAPTGFAEDRAGNIWISLYHNQLARYRNGQFTVYQSDQVPGFLNTVFLDSAGRLWIASTEALLRVDDPTQDPPHFLRYTTAQGLSSDSIAWLTEDRWGRLYAATGRGIDRFEPQAGGLGRIRHYTSADGVVGGALAMAMRDRQGNLWFDTDLGVSQLVPTADPPQQPPPVLVTGLSIGGVPQAVSDLGQSAIADLKLSPNPLRIDFVGLGYSPGEMLRYQYMLEGADKDWSTPTEERAVTYGRLPAGSYRFLVRAVTSDGAMSRQPASVSFTVLPPFWRTWWFLTACGVAAGLVIYGLHRYRLAQLLAVANVRTRIATDLHDDIGASLSQIAILSEVAKGAWNGAEARNGSPLSEIAEISRELVDAMSDIVWAINPDHDHLSNLVYRMRRFATDVLGGHGIGLQFRSTVSEPDLRVGADVRRHVYLIFKEAVHNIVKHAAASQVEVDLDLSDDVLVLRLSDNGRGFDPRGRYEGRGVANFQKRADALHAALELKSSPGTGATLRLEVPMEGRMSLSGLRGK